MNTITKIIITLLLLLSFSFSGELYKVHVDEQYGFYKVRASDPTHKVEYQDRTLQINTSDTVEWINYNDPDYKIVLLSDPVLWDNTSGILRWGLQKYNYTFNTPGIFKIYEKSFPKLYQIIIVYPSSASISSPYYKPEIPTYPLKEEFINVTENATGLYSYSVTYSDSPIPPEPTQTPGKHIINVPDLYTVESILLYTCIILLGVLLIVKLYRNKLKNEENK